MEPLPSAVLVVLDGWGLAPDGPGNAVSLAETPVFDDLWARYPHTSLTASGGAVGLPDGQMGNSEVGHLNLGAGAVIKQDLTRIDEAVADGSLAENEVLRAAFADAERVHLIGLVSDGGVHSGPKHLEALVRMGAELGVPDLVVHAFTDGRDTSPTGGERFLADLEAWLAAAGNGRVGSVIGRYYAMDRDKRWDRTQLAYDLLVHGRGAHAAATGVEAARDAYAREETDEFITRDDRRRGGAHPSRRLRHRVQLPPRPDARDHAGARRPRLRRRRSRGRGAGRALRHADGVRGRLDVPGRVPSGPARDRRCPRSWPRPAGVSCTWPRPRSTRT